MAETEQPQIYLVTPPEMDPATFPDTLAAVLDAVEIACVRLAPSTRDDVLIARLGDALRDVAHARDIPLVIEQHVMMVERLGLDGVHLTDGPRQVRKTRKLLGADAIVGTFCGASRHDAMTAGEAGADYVAFGPVGQTTLGDGTLAGYDLFAWWSEMIEVPVVAEGNLDEDIVATLSPVADFLCFGSEVWETEDPLARLKSLVSAIAG